MVAGPAIIPLIEIEVVQRYEFMTRQEFGEVLAMGNALPGPIATKMAGYIGFEVAGVLGSLVALAGDGYTDVSRHDPSSQSIE